MKKEEKIEIDLRTDWEKFSTKERIFKLTDKLADASIALLILGCLFSAVIFVLVSDELSNLTKNYSPSFSNQTIIDQMPKAYLLQVSMYGNIFSMLALAWAFVLIARREQDDEKNKMKFNKIEECLKKLEERKR